MYEEGIYQNLWLPQAADYKGKGLGLPKGRGSKDMKKVYIKTFGCQMNEHDAEIMLSRMRSVGYQRVLTPDEADVVLINTCSVRDKAYQKALSEIGRHRKNDRTHPMILGVTGCVASQEGASIKDRYPHVDLVVGPDHIKDIDKYISELTDDSYVVASHFLDKAADQFPMVGDFIPESSVKAYVTIMKGCNHVCSYCIVPSVRGPEVSRDPEAIIKEINLLVEKGIKEVMLLGQNVNSYGRNFGSTIDFTDLVDRIDKETPVQRLRFASPHPTNLSQNLIELYSTSRSLCPHIHLPLQSGSSEVLKKMRRSYTREVYRKKIDQLRKVRPDVTVTSDIIVGFPGETDAHFEETLAYLKEIQFDNVYAFSYSPRPGTEAAQFHDDVPDTVKEERLQILFNLQRDIAYQKNLTRVGCTEEVLVEGESRKGKGQLTGRTPHNRIVNFYGDPQNRGVIMNVKIKKAHPYSLSGEIHG